MNLVALTGHLGKDPELRYTQTQKAVASFSVATTEKRQTQNGIQTVTTWHDIVCWEKIAENVNKYCSKGSKVAITGKINKRSYDNKQGQKVYVTEVVAHSVEFLSAPKQQESTNHGGSYPQNNQNRRTNNDNNDVDSIPF